jgi:hypothetical protein
MDVSKYLFIAFKELYFLIFCDFLFFQVRFCNVFKSNKSGPFFQNTFPFVST